MRRLLWPICAIIVACCLFPFPSSAQTQESAATKLLVDSIGKLDVAGAKVALAKGADPNWRDSRFASDESSVLSRFAGHATAMKDQPKAEERSTMILEALFKAGAKLQPWDRDILFYPVLSSWVSFAEVLLKNGANPARETGLGETPMEMAIRHNDVIMVNLLKKYGAPALEPRAAAQVALIGAAEDNDISRMDDAIDNGAEVNSSDRQGETALVVACLSHVSQIAPDEYSAAVLYLLKKGADPTIQGSRFGSLDSRTTALHSVIYMSSFLLSGNRQLEKSERLKDAPAQFRAIIEALLKHGALVSARDWAGKTPLHIAAERNNILGAQMLIDAGCKIMPADREGKTPLDYAESAEMIKLLKDHGAKEE